MKRSKPQAKVNSKNNSFCAHLPLRICSAEQVSPQDPWYINSPVDHCCFWCWVARRSDAEGWMTPISQSEAMQLLQQNNNKIGILYKDAIEHLTELLIKANHLD